MKIAPSVLAANVKNFEKDLQKVSNADYMHIDIMDGHFVPNISFGPHVTSAMHECSTVPFDVHLMLSHPLQYIEQFVKAGAKIISFHLECEDDTKEVVEKIKSFGVLPAIAVKPNTKIEEVYPYCNDIFMVVVMTVEPGFGGQSFMQNQMEKVVKLKENFPNVVVEVDGGIGRANIQICKESGVDICVCGTSVFASENPFEEVEFLQKA